MRKEKAFGIIALLVCTCIWGSAFVMQSKAGKYLTPFYINAMRFLIGGIVLIPFCFIGKKQNKRITKKSLLGGVLIGVALCVASNLQQFGIDRTTPGKAGFLTAMNIIFVPLISLLLFKQKINWKQWCAILLSIVGVSLLTLDSSFSINLGDILCLLCAFFFAIHILLCDHFSKTENAVMLSMISFFTASILSLLLALPLEKITIDSFKQGIPYVLYLGIMSCGVAYTLQIIGQKHISQIPATLLLSLESVWSVIWSMIIDKQVLTLKEFFGCSCMLIAVILIQVLKNDEKEQEEAVILNND